MANDLSEWLLRGSASATIIYNDPAWSEQAYAMQRGERAPGAFDPPVPAEHVDAVRARWDHAHRLQERMVAEGRPELPDGADPHAWAAVGSDMLLAGRYADRRGIRWVPVTLMADYRTLQATPLPGSTELAT